MTAFSGSSLYLAWVWSGGTITLHGDFREFSYEPTLSLIESTAGSDSFREYIGGIGEGGDIKFSSVMQKAGTLLITACARQNTGTLLVGVEGTTATMPKITIPAICKGPAFNVPYNDVVEFSVGFQQNAAETLGVW